MIEKKEIFYNKIKMKGLVILLILISFTVSQVLGKPACKDHRKPGCNIYKGIIVGGGFGGISFTYYVDLIQRLSQETGIKLTNNIDLSDLLLIEKDSFLGGNSRAKVASVLDPVAVARAEALYNVSGDWLVDLGPQRIPQLTCKADRSTAIDSQTIEEFTPYYSYEFSRGRRAVCDVPNFNNYSPDNPYGISGTCTDSRFVFVGDPFVNYTNGLAPAYNLTGMQTWAREYGAAFAVSESMVYDSANPILCPTQDTPCTECGNCWSNISRFYPSLKAAMIGEFGHEATDEFIQDFGGFYADFNKNTNNPTDWATPYYYREYSTDAINGYTVNSTFTHAQNVAKPILQQGTVLLNTKVVAINSAGGGNSVQVTVEDGTIYQAGWVILGIPPEEITSGAVKGNIPQKLNSTAIFHGPYCVPVLTTTAAVDFPFWKILVPEYGNGTTEWVQLRAFGEQGHASRIEIRNTIAGSTYVEFRSSYNDYIAIEIYDKFIGREDVFKQELWTMLRNDIAYAFQLERDQLPETAVNIQVDYFESGWCYTNGTNLENPNDPLSRFTAAEIRDFAINPLDMVYMVNQAWNVEFLGWKESALRMSMSVLGSLIPEANFLLQCWMYKTFPECPSNVTCLEDPTTYILGTETLIPSRYCTEHWWFNNYTLTPGCVKKVHLTPADIPLCEAAIQKYGKI